MTESKGLAQSEGVSGKLIDQRLGKVRQQVQGRGFMQPSCLLKLNLTGSYCEGYVCVSCTENTEQIQHRQLISTGIVVAYTHISTNAYTF